MIKKLGLMISVVFLLAGCSENKENTEGSDVPQGMEVLNDASDVLQDQKTSDVSSEDSSPDQKGGDIVEDGVLLAILDSKGRIIIGQDRKLLADILIPGYAVTRA